MININVIGIVRSKFKELSDPVMMRESDSIIEIKEEFSDGLYRLDELGYIEVLFNFHMSEDYDLKTVNYFGEYKGIFATRSPRRPSSIGLSKVKLIRREKNLLHVKGLDAVDGTPVIDIKPLNAGIIADEKDNIECCEIKENPRKKIISLAKNNKIEKLMALAGSLHGHYCPGLAMGVIGAVYSVNKLKRFSDGMEDILAVIEINSCFTDGIQYVTGCTLGNNSLIFRDFGKTAFSLVKKDGTGFRLASNPSFRDTLNIRSPEFTRYYNLVVAEKNRDEVLLSEFKKVAKEACFSMVQWDIEDIFRIEEVKLKLPDYAPVRKSVFCVKCGEEVMKGKEIIKDDKVSCKGCMSGGYYQLDGEGISKQ